MLDLGVADSGGAVGVFGRGVVTGMVTTNPSCLGTKVGVKSFSSIVSGGTWHAFSKASIIATTTIGVARWWSTDGLEQ